MLFHLQYIAIKGLWNSCLKMGLTSCCANQKWTTRMKQAAASHSLYSKHMHIFRYRTKLKSPEVSPKNSVGTAHWKYHFRQTDKTSQWRIQKEHGVLYCCIKLDIIWYTYCLHIQNQSLGFQFHQMKSRFNYSEFTQNQMHSKHTHTHLLKTHPRDAWIFVS